MIEAPTTTAFWLVRRLAMGQGSGAMYLLLHDEDVGESIESDLRAETEVQLDLTLPIERFSAMGDASDQLTLPDAGPIRALSIDRCTTALVTLLDTHVVRLERTGAQFLFLTTAAIAEQLLLKAPNFRNRLTDVLRIIPDDLSGGDPR